MRLTPIVFLTLAVLVASDGYDYITNISIRCTANDKWTDFSSTVLQLLVSGKIFTRQQAINFLETFDIRGTGEFSDNHGAAAYNSSISESFGGNQVRATRFSNAIKQLIKEREDCASLQAFASAKCAHQNANFLEILLKLSIGNKLITTKNATALAAKNGATLTVLEEELSTEFNCMQQHFEFKKICENHLAGIADGGRCFFVPDVPPTTWNDAFAVCKNRGAILAAVLTSSEMSKITSVFKPRYGDRWVWTSGKRTTPSLAETGGTCSYSRNSTYVFSNVTDYNPLLVYGNTWFRNRKNGRCDNNNDSPLTQCIVVWEQFTLFGDWYCNSAENRLKPLCQLSGPPQQFIRVDNVCLAETAIVDTSVTSASECATICDRNSWCRSFNLINGTKCQLFPWE